MAILFCDYLEEEPVAVLCLNLHVLSHFGRKNWQFFTLLQDLEIVTTGRACNTLASRKHGDSERAYHLSLAEGGIGNGHVVTALSWEVLRVDQD